MNTTAKFAMALAAIAIAGLMPALQAQPQEDGPPPRGEMRGPRAARPMGRLQMMTHRLSLTDEQAATLKPLFNEDNQKRKAIREDSTLTAEQRQAQLRQLRESFHAQVEAVLTPEQKEMWAKDRERMKERRGGHRPPAPFMESGTPGDEPPPPPPDDEECPPPCQEKQEAQ